MKRLQFLFAGSLFLCLAACQESWNLDRSDFSQIEMDKVEILSSESVKFKAKVYDLSFFSATDYGFVLTKDGSVPTIYSFDEKSSIAATDSGVVSQSFEMTKSDLPPGTLFVVRAYAEVKGDVMYSDTLQFETPTGMVTTLSLEYDGGNELMLRGKLSGTELGVFGIKHGFCWSGTNPNPSLEDGSINLGSKLTNNEFSYTYDGLIDDYPLHFRAYGILQANESLDTVYGKILFFDGIIRDRWEAGIDFEGSAREGAVTFSINGKGYLVGGEDIDSVFKDVWEYNPQSDEWAQKNDFPGVARRGPVGFTLKNKGYYGLGKAGGYLTDFYEYDPSNDSWMLQATFPDSGRTGALGLADDQYGYITTGAVVGVPDNKIYRFDPTIGLNGGWKVFPGHIGFKRYSAAGFILDSNLYVIGGRCASPSTECNFMLEDVWAFNLQNPTWEKQPNFPGGTRLDASSFVVNGRGYVGFGTSFYSVFLDDLWSFKGGEWRKMASLENGERAGAINFVINDQVFLGLGNVKIEAGTPQDVYTYSKDMWLYYPPQ